MGEKIISAGRFVGSVIPFLFACYSGVVYGQTVETRVAALEISSAVHEAQYRAIVDRIEALDKTVWWLVVTTIGGTGVSGVVAIDRATYKRRNRN